MTWFGHLHRMNANIPAKKAFNYAQQQFQLARGRPKLTWVKMVKEQLIKDFELTWNEAKEKTRDRKEWRTLIYNKYL